MLYLALLLVAIPLFGMPAWMAHCRKQNSKRYLAHWLVSLVPVGLYVLMMAINPKLASYSFIQYAVTFPAVLGAAAFSGGFMYLFIKTFYKNESRRNNRNNDSSETGGLIDQFSDNAVNGVNMFNKHPYGGYYKLHGDCDD